MRYRFFAIVLPLILLLTACNLGANEAPTETPTITPINSQPTGSPVITISSPTNGAEVIVNERVFVNATITNAIGITNVQLFANGRVVKALPFESPSTEAIQNVLLDYIPTQQESVTLRVVVLRDIERTESETIQINVRANQAAITATSPATGPQIDPSDPTCRALINTGLNFRSGPSTNYNVIQVLSTGTIAPIIGRLGDNSWWQLRVGTTVGWVSSQFTTEYGICTGVPVVNPPPSPTPPTTATATSTATSAPTSTSTSAPSQPDLQVRSITGERELTIASGSTTVSSTYAITVVNSGGQSTAAFRVTMDVGGQTREVASISSLDPGQQIGLQAMITFDTAQTYTLVVRVDPDESVAESNEFNNTSEYRVTVTAATSEE